MQTAITHPALRAISNTLYRKNNLFLFLLLTPPLLWFGVVYLGSLFALLWQSFYTFDDFSMSVTNDLTLDNYRALFDSSNLDIILRTLSMAVAVTLACACIGFPIAYYMTRYGSAREKGFFYIAVMLPMWGKLHCENLCVDSHLIARRYFILVIQSLRVNRCATKFTAIAYYWR